MTQPFAIGVKGKGQAVRLIVTTDADHAQTLVASGELTVALKTMPPGPVTIDANGNVVDLPPTIDQVRAARWLDAKAYRKTRMTSGCTTALGRVQTDPDSRLAIREAADEASANLVKVPGWSVTWVMADNTTATHTAAQMVAMAAAVRTYVNACQAASQAIRTKVFTAATPAAVAAIDITAGYPAN